MIRRPKCPVCESELPLASAEANREFPFCSRRCRQIDLFRWTQGRYAIVTELDPAVAQLLSEEAGASMAGIEPDSHSDESDDPDSAV